MPLIDLQEATYDDSLERLIDKFNDNMRLMSWLLNNKIDTQNFKLGIDAGDFLTPGSVTDTLLADAAVTTRVLAPLSVDNTILANLAVEAANLANSAVTAEKIANLAVGSAAIAALAVGTGHIANAAITNAKINDLSASKINTGTLDASLISIANDIILGTSTADIDNKIKFNRNTGGPTIYDTGTINLGISAASIYLGGNVDVENDLKVDNIYSSDLSRIYFNSPVDFQSVAVYNLSGLHTHDSTLSVNTNDLNVYGDIIFQGAGDLNMYGERIVNIEYLQLDSISTPTGSSGRFYFDGYNLKIYTSSGWKTVAYV